ncbi:hypothetical protein, partial [Mycobacterium sp.]|uniref:hypothetical protein n=1 Tax=Mycobacterium sp. TaxID=1785 RepID=UPI003F9CFC87
ARPQATPDDLSHPHATIGITNRPEPGSHAFHQAACKIEVSPSLLVSIEDLGRRRDDFTDVSACVTGESGGAQRLELECLIFEDEFHDPLASGHF